MNITEVKEEWADTSVLIQKDRQKTSIHFGMECE